MSEYDNVEIENFQKHWLSVWLSVCLSVCLPACLWLCLSVCLSVCLSAYMAVCLTDFVRWLTDIPTIWLTERIKDECLYWLIWIYVGQYIILCEFFFFLYLLHINCSFDYLVWSKLVTLRWPCAVDEAVSLKNKNKNKNKKTRINE